MKTISIEASKRYQVLVGRGLLRRCGELTARVHPPCKALIVTDNGLPRRWIETAEQSLAQAGYAVYLHTFPMGEAHKTLDTVEGILDSLTAHGLTRSDLIVALGGGIVGDVAGFAASCYLRGIDFIQLPTTLLAAVDSSVGGKTGVNLRAGKNLAGAFFQPSLVLCDPDVLSTLPPKRFADGAAESVKYGMLGGEKLLAPIAGGALEDERELESIIARCIELKGELVERDERDIGRRQTLNLGHTIGHAIERVSDYEISHGHAVAMGMVVITRAAARLGHCSAACLDRLLAALERNHLPIRCHFPPEALCAAALQDKKRGGATQTLVVPREVGNIELVTIPVEELPRWVKTGMEERS